MKKDDGFNAPFSKLKTIKITKDKEKKKIKKQSEIKEKQPVPLDEQTLFTHAMDGVKPIKNDLIAQEPPDQNLTIKQIRENLIRQDKEVINKLHALIKGTEHFDITNTGEYMEGHVIPFDTATMKKLKHGEFSVQAHLDLHGYTKSDALDKLTSFIHNAHSMGDKVLLIIHGRGLTSSQGPILKESIVRWLTTGSLSHLVLAFCSARPCDGGTGALYVLLKKRPKKSVWKRPL